MKLKITTIAIATALLAVGLMSNANGPAQAGNGNKTGSPGTSTCQSCHGGGGTLSNAAISLKKKSDNSPANGRYNPGATYIVEITAHHASLSNYGFQVAALDNNDDQAGAFQNAGSGKHIRTSSGVALVEHAQVLTQPSGFNTQFEWVAPAVGKGTVTFYGMVNAVNADGNTGGDAPSNPVTLTLSEDPVGIAEVESASELKIYPNPASDVLHISGLKAPALIEVYSLNGKLVSTVTAPANEAAIPLQALTAGVYSLKIYAYDTLYNRMFIKQ